MMETITVSKEEAKKMIDDMPGDEFTFVRINLKTHIHGKPKRKNKEFGKELIDISKKVDYQDNDFFGVFRYMGAVNAMKTLFITYYFHNWNKVTEQTFEKLIDKKFCTMYTNKYKRK